MTELERAKQYAKENDGEDAIVEEPDYHGVSLYRLVPFKGYERLRLGPPILFVSKGDAFSFLSRREIDLYDEWRLAGVRYEDD